MTAPTLSPPAVYADRDGDTWLEEPDGMLSPLSGPIAWALPDSVKPFGDVDAMFGPLREVTP